MHWGTREMTKGQISGLTGTTVSWTLSALLRPFFFLEVHRNVLNPLGSKLIQNQCPVVPEICDHFPSPSAFTSTEGLKSFGGKDGKKTDHINFWCTRVLPQRDLEGNPLHSRGFRPVNTPIHDLLEGLWFPGTMTESGFLYVCPYIFFQWHKSSKPCIGFLFHFWEHWLVSQGHSDYCLASAGFSKATSLTSATLNIQSNAPPLSFQLSNYARHCKAWHAEISNDRAQGHCAPLQSLSQGLNEGCIFWILPVWWITVKMANPLPNCHFLWSLSVVCHGIGASLTLPPWAIFSNFILLPPSQRLLTPFFTPQAAALRSEVLLKRPASQA